MDFCEAAHHFKLSADQGNSFAQFTYGLCLERGRGISADVREAAGYFGQCANQGNPFGANSLGLCLERGRDVPVDLAEVAAASDRLLIRAIRLVSSIMLDAWNAALVLQLTKLKLRADTSCAPIQALGRSMARTFRRRSEWFDDISQWPIHSHLGSHSNLQAIPR
jgi:TPR repeat protein